ncbi:hypothetical protein [Blastococcus brunescens]|uniref:Uncharacterized protein n=1 Tax=Blastococcus brunescens TaxID=1564165 RepID=A0ABZ1AT69_9ACTN|nr:hypothetical protein [Blastococcus sp. BMG 8361]WRL61770.1 hypothetical protein U6N30_16715 [Blastococcus sp. BMG 8361]
MMVRPLRVHDGPGAIVVVEPADAATDTSLWPTPPAGGVEQAQLSLLPPSLPLLPDVHLSGSYHRASVDELAGATGSTRWRSGPAGWRSSWATRSATACPPPAR